MPHFDPSDDVYASNSHFLSPSLSTPGRKTPSRQNLNARRSTASLRPSNLALSLEDEPTGAPHHSLAHELAFALMPEPSAGSKLLAEEFGIEFDEETEGVDTASDHHSQHHGDHFLSVESDIPSFASELADSVGDDALFHSNMASELGEPSQELEYDPVFHTPTVSRRKVPQKKPDQDAMEVLAEDLESTDKFLGHLRSMDAEAGPSQPALERLASDVIRRINDATRDREGHLRELLEYEREFKKIAGEVGGSDVLGQLDELTHIDDLSDQPSRPALDSTRQEPRILEVLNEEPRSPVTLRHHHASDWEVDPDRRLGDEDELSEPPTSPLKDSFLAPPTMTGPPTPAIAVQQLHHLRSFTTSLITSLATISEQAQVNGAATTEAGRKIRALKNKMGGWQTEWESAERSRLRIEKWEAGIPDGEDNGIPTTPSRSTSKRIDGRRIVAEQLQAFELVLADATLKTQAIMAR